MTRRTLATFALSPLAWLYGMGTQLRNKLFDWKVLNSRAFPVPVICVGNLAVGGTGKTPHVEYLIQLLSPHYQVAVLSRGYKRKTRGYHLASTASTVAEIGDEPWQIKHKYPHIHVAVDANRCRGIELLMTNKETSNTEVILLDDAFQHRYVKPGLNILLTCYERLFCDDYLLPAGRLRESAKGKSRADIVVVTKCPDKMPAHMYNLISGRLNLLPHQQLFFSTVAYVKLISIDGKDSHTLDILHDKHVLLVTGIAQPQHLKEMLRQHAVSLQHTCFPDHHTFSVGDINSITQTFNTLPHPKLIVTTEKDATRLCHCPTLPQAMKGCLFILPIEIQIMRNQSTQFNDKLLQYVRSNSRNSQMA